jgi:hypothetical protein
LSKKLHSNQKIDLDNAIRDIENDFKIGESKSGDLKDVRVYKFKMAKQLTLIAYQLLGDNLIVLLLTFGSYENFYNDLKRLLK